MVLFVLSCSDNSTNTSGTTLKGQVIDANFKPVANVLIKSIPQSTTILTDQNGNFEISDIAPGDYRIITEKPNYYPGDEAVKVISSKTTNMIIIINSIIDKNKPPTIPIFTNLTNNQTISSTSLIVNWDCSDPENDPISYDIYFSKKNPPVAKVEDSYIKQTYTIDSLTDSTDYYIQIVARDFYHAVSNSSVLHVHTNFTTIPITTSNIIAIFKFDGNATDSSASSITADFIGCSFTNGRKSGSQAASFLGSNSTYINYPANTLLNLTNFTISMWIKPSTSYGVNPTNSNSFFLVSRWGGTGQGTSSYKIELSTNGYVVGSTYGTNLIINSVTSSKIVQENTWSHIAFVCDNGDLKLFINGVADNTASGSVPQSSNYSFVIGKNYLVSNGFYNGLIDDLIIYNKVLTSNEIKVLAQ